MWLENGKTYTTTSTTKTGRLYHRLRHTKFLKCFIKVSYGVRETNYDKTIIHSDGTKTRNREMFYNSATCLTKNEALATLEIFLGEK